MVEQARRKPIKGKNPDVLDIALQFIEGRGCVIHVRDSSRRYLESKQLGIGKLKDLVTPRERDRYSITVGVEMSIRAKRYRVTGMRNAEVVAVGTMRADSGAYGHHLEMSTDAEIVGQEWKRAWTGQLPRVGRQHRGN